MGVLVSWTISDLPQEQGEATEVSCCRWKTSSVFPSPATPSPRAKLACCTSRSSYLCRGSRDPQNHLLIRRTKSRSRERPSALRAWSRSPPSAKCRRAALGSVLRARACGWREEGTARGPARPRGREWVSHRDSKRACLRVCLSWSLGFERWQCSESCGG